MVGDWRRPGPQHNVQIWGGGQLRKDLYGGETLGLRICPHPLEALSWRCIYVLSNTLIISVSQLLGFEYRYNRILQAT